MHPRSGRRQIYFHSRDAPPANHPGAEHQARWLRPQCTYRTNKSWPAPNQGLLALKSSSPPGPEQQEEIYPHRL